MKTPLKIAAALLASTFLAGASYAQESTNGASSAAPGIVKPDDESAKSVAPGQKQVTGEVDSATEAAPGQVMKDQAADDDAAAKTETTAQGEVGEKVDEGASGAASGSADAAADDSSADMDASGSAAADTDAATDDAAAADQPSNETTASIDVSAEQRTELKEVFTAAEVEPVDDIDIELNVGVAIPSTVTLHPLPPRVVEIVPAYRGYDYFVLADGRIVIVEPDTHVVVYILT